MSKTAFDSNYLARKRGRQLNADSPNGLFGSFLGITGRQRDAELWYEDGTVILVAQEYVFHRFLLCYNRMQPSYPPPYGFTGGPSPHQHLTLDDIGLCFEARSKIARAGVAAALRVCTPKVSTKCQTRSVCRKTLRKLAARLRRSSKLLCGPDPFAPLSELCEDTAVCSACRGTATEGALALLEVLASWFGLRVEGWGKEKETVVSGDSVV